MNVQSVRQSKNQGGMDEVMGKPANYEIFGTGPGLVILRDLGPWSVHLTITNDAERVVREVAAKYPGRKIIYYDSEGDLTELIVKDGEFGGLK